MGNQIINHAIVVGQNEMNREYLNEVFAELTRNISERSLGVDWASLHVDIARHLLPGKGIEDMRSGMACFYEVHATVLAVTEDEDD